MPGTWYCHALLCVRYSMQMWMLLRATCGSWNLCNHAQYIVNHLTKGIVNLFCSMVSVCRIICFVQDGLAADVQQTKDDMRYTQLTSTKAGTKCKNYYCGLNSKSHAQNRPCCTLQMKHNQWSWLGLWQAVMLPKRATLYKQHATCRTWYRCTIWSVLMPNSVWPDSPACIMFFKPMLYVQSAS